MTKLPLTFLLLLFHSISFSSQLHLTNGPEIENVQFTDTLENAERNTSLKYPVTVTMVNGESFKGAVLNSTDSTVTYQTSIGSVTVAKKDILSVRNNSMDSFRSETTSTPDRQVNRITVKEYNSLPLLVLSAAGVAGAIIWFKDSSDDSNAADALNQLGFTNLSDQASTKSTHELLYGFGASLVALVSFVVAITPTEHYIDQPVTIIPTTNGIRLAVHF